MFENKQRSTWMDIDDTYCLSTEEEKKLRKRIAERKKSDSELRKRLKEFDDYIKENYLK